MGGNVQDSMTFRSFNSQAKCKLCSTNPATLEFEILTEHEHSRQQGFCCTQCAGNLLEALCGVKPQTE